MGGPPIDAGAAPEVTRSAQRPLNRAGASDLSRSTPLFVRSRSCSDVDPVVARGAARGIGVHHRGRCRWRTPAFKGLGMRASRYSTTIASRATTNSCGRDWSCSHTGSERAFRTLQETDFQEAGRLRGMSALAREGTGPRNRSLSQAEPRELHRVHRGRGKGRNCSVSRFVRHGARPKTSEARPLQVLFPMNPTSQNLPLGSLMSEAWPRVSACAIGGRGQGADGGEANLPVRD